jgi:branched-chain amino acid transport system substrate-binding protein
LASSASLALFLGACGGGSDDSSNSPSTSGTSSSSSAASGKPYVIAEISDLSGPVGVFDTPPYDGMKAYFDYLNSTGGVNGRPITTKASDAKGDVQTTLASFTQYSGQSDVIAITGLGLDTQMDPLLPKLASTGIAAISSPSSTTSGLPYNKWYFSFGEDYGGDVTATAQYLSEKDSSAKIGYVAFDSPATRSVASNLTKAVAGTGVSVVGKEFLPPTATDASQAISSLVHAGATWIAIGAATDPQFTSILQNAKVQNFDGNILAIAGGGEDSNFKLASTDKYKALRSFHSPSETNLPGVAKMVSEVDGAKPDKYYYSMGWALGEVIAKALTTCGSDCTRAGFRDALETTSFSDPYGLAASAIGFSDTCHQGFRSTFVYGWDGSKPVQEGSIDAYNKPPCGGS